MLSFLQYVYMLSYQKLGSCRNMAYIYIFNWHQMILHMWKEKENSFTIVRDAN